MPRNRTMRVRAACAIIADYLAMLAYACTIFLSAFLLFAVQPMIGKIILPWFGGSAAVWSTCLLFFQAALLAGYFYADRSTRLLKPKRQATLHIALMAAAWRCFPFCLRPLGSRPTPAILRCAFCCCSLPPSACLTFCSPPPARCCKPGTWRPNPARFRIGCSRCRISARCWRC